MFQPSTFQEKADFGVWQSRNMAAYLLNLAVYSETLRTLTVEVAANMR